MQELINVRVHDYYWDEDLSCAVTTLKILSELFYTELHPQVVEAAFGLNAGRFGSQCGLVEGALLFIGSYGSYRNMNKENIAVICHEFCRKFQARFGGLLCNELRTQGFSPGNPPHLCENITKQAVTFSAQFILEEMGMAC
ncbi:C-GCAxxG-C-C family protein [Pelosinus baikalensis]|uniref:C-GCAxxG-C-C family protein n=1 Tax=Pelosinus baikalensis TaxID=2892015 RepID=A0ABS8HR67_9FIRM|nr:C-GCAxxG-C-C family protein [Pelosinus baikalensis]MCC5465676.1 C-GCAxxG-C-C family protein [Pelosinus baikalensis]